METGRGGRDRVPGESNREGDRRRTEREKIKGYGTGVLVDTH